MKPSLVRICVSVYGDDVIDKYARVQGATPDSPGVKALKLVKNQLIRKPGSYEQNAIRFKFACSCVEAFFQDAR